MIDLFAALQRRELMGRKGKYRVMVTELTRPERTLLRLVSLPATDYGR